MVREIGEGVYWIQECSERSPEPYRRDPPDWFRPDRRVHGTRSAYLIVSDETLLFDTLSPAARNQILKSLDDVLAGRRLDYLVASHPETPHAGNTHAILREYPETRLVAPAYGSTHELYYLKDSMKVREGDEITLGDHAVRFVTPTFMDHYMSVWMHEVTTDTLFCVDWFGLSHMDDECLRFTDEIDSPITCERLLEHPQRPFFWFKYADLSKTDAEIERLIGDYGSSMLAPTHGLVIRADAERHMNTMKQVVRKSRYPDDFPD